MYVYIAVLLCENKLAASFNKFSGQLSVRNVSNWKALTSMHSKTNNHLKFA